MNNMRRKVLPTFILVVSVGISNVHAEIVLDGTTGTSGAITGPDFVVTEDMGQRIDNTLLHSFSDFNLASTESALFTGDNAISTVISRVTGTNASSIDGSITTDFGGVDFWFINPNGVMFGENASINVNGAFHVTTADALILDNGTVIDVTTDLSSPTLTISAPESFHFLSDSAASIEIMSGEIFASSNFLDFSSGTDVTFAAGNIDITSAKIEVPNGSLNLIASDAAIVPVDNFTAGTAPNISNGTHQVLISDSETRVGDTESGAFNVFAASFEVNDFSELAITLATDSALNADTVTITEDSFFDIEVSDSAVIADFDINAATVEVSDGAILSTITANAGDDIQGANLNIDATAVVIDDGIIASRVGSNAQNSTGGDIIISSQTFLLTGDLTTGSGGKLSIVDAGAESSITSDISIDASEMITISNGGSITQSIGSGGTIALTAPTIQALDAINALVPLFESDNAPSNVIITAETLLLDNANFNNRVTDNSTGGSFVVDVDTLTMRNGSSINTKTFGSADGVNIEINAADAILSGGSFIGASTLAGGTGGEINLDVTNTLTLTGSNDTFESSIRSTTADLTILDSGANESVLFARDDLATGIGGIIRVSADAIVLSDGAKITALSGATDDEALGRTVDSGNAGSIELVANRLDVSGDSSIETKSEESAGGSIDIRVRDFIGITDSAIKTDSKGASQENPGGDIFIDPELLLLKNAIINANANGGNGGNIQIIADNILQDPNTLITASSKKGIDGDISIDGVTNEVSTLAALDLPYDDVSKMLSKQCNISALKDRSSFVISGKQNAVNSADESPSNYQLSSAVGDDAEYANTDFNTYFDQSGMALALLELNQNCI